MTHYLTEDSAGSPFVSLFNSAYGRNVLIPVGSSSLLAKKADKLAVNGDSVIVYLDLVPDNPRLQIAYESLLEVIRSGKPVAVLPIICAEYNFIMSVLGVVGPIYTRDGLDIILEKSLDYTKSTLYLSRVGKKSSKKWFKSFETYCKLFCARCLDSSCCSVTSNECSSKPYFSGDCDCSWCQTRLTLKEKATLYLSQLHIVPSLGGVTYGTMDWDEVLKCSESLLDEYERWALRFDPKCVLLPRK